ncbi:MAG: hypothetical protein HXS46_07770 [Theionarchaea archaeon]|nr:hypothetical protein [Theionarchaea archaeon]
MDEEEIREGIEQEIRAIDSTVEKVRREADTTLKNIEAAMLEIGDALLYKLEEDDKKKSAMVINASVIAKKEGDLIKGIVKLVEKLSEFVKNVYNVTYELNVIPESCVLLGRHWKYFSSVVSQSTTETNRIATLSGYNKSASKPMIRSCCRLVAVICMLERHALTKNPWIIDRNQPYNVSGQRTRKNVKEGQVRQQMVLKEVRITSQVRGSGNSKAGARSDAQSQPTAYCKEREWEEDDCTYSEASPSYWECDLWFHCK